MNLAGSWRGGAARSWTGGRPGQGASTHRQTFPVSPVTGGIGGEKVKIAPSPCWGAGRKSGNRGTSDHKPGRAAEPSRTPLLYRKERVDGVVNANPSCFSGLYVLYLSRHKAKLLCSGSVYPRIGTSSGSQQWFSTPNSEALFRGETGFLCPMYHSRRALP